MKVRELIKSLQKWPPETDVTVWDAEADDFVPVTGSILEDGSSDVTLITGDQNESDWIEVPAGEHG